MVSVLERKKTGKRSIFREMISWMVYLVLICAAVYLLVHFVGERTQVRGESMYPALNDGDNLIVDKISYRFSDPKRFDVIVFPFRYQEDTYYIKRIIAMYPALNDGDNLIVDKISYRFSDPKRFDVIVFPFRYQEDTYYIKRIIGLPGETVQIFDGDIYINGRVLKEPFGSDKIKNGGLASETITLGQNEYFVLGDNRNDSADSAMTVRTAESRVSEILTAKILSERHGFVSGHSIKLDFCAISRRENV